MPTPTVPCPVWTATTNTVALCPVCPTIDPEKPSYDAANPTCRVFSTALPGPLEKNGNNNGGLPSALQSEHTKPAPFVFRELREAQNGSYIKFLLCPCRIKVSDSCDFSNVQISECVQQSSFPCTAGYFPCKSQKAARFRVICKEAESDFGNQFVAYHGLTTLVIANCARLSTLFAVFARIRFLPRSPP